MSDTIIDVTTESFMADVIEASKTQLVLLDLWAPWCGPCKQLTPVLENLVKAGNGALRLAKMNIDDHPAVAQQLQVQSIPAVFAFKDGRPVDGFMGALPESQIKEFIAKHLEGGLGQTPEEQLLESATQAFSEKSFQQAAEAYGALLQINPENRTAQAGLVHCYLATGQIEHAEQLLGSAPELERNKEPLAAAFAALKLAQQSNETSGETAQLEAAVEGNPNDHQARFDLALAYQAAGNKQGAVDALLEIIERKRDWNDDAARQQLLTLFQAFGFDDPISVEGRKRLSSILFS